MNPRYSAKSLTEFAARLLLAAGLDREKAEITADILVEGDLMGHTTHGLHLLAAYLNDAATGKMTKTGEPRTIADFPAALTWDGNRLPGPWLTVKAIERAAERAKTQGAASVAIRRSHHIACLAAYGKLAVDQGMMLVMACSDPGVAAVAPHGGREGAYSPNPIAAAWPTDHGPVILDISQSIVAQGSVRRAHAEKKRLAGKWMLDSAGEPTDDPAVMFDEPPGPMLPTGGVDHGHKGFALALLVEALTGGLAGHGRADPTEGWSATVFVQILNPALFAGRDDFVRQTSWIADKSRRTKPRPGFDAVRLPGERGLRRRDEQLKGGVELYPSIMPSLKPWAEKLGIPAPSAL